MSKKIKNTKRYFAFTLFISWLVITSSVIWFYSLQIYGSFAENGNWPASFSPTLKQLELAKHGGWQVIHIQDAACRCNFLINKHLTAFDDIPNLNQTHMSLKQLNEKGISLPATPAMLAYYNGELLYAGPYAQGALCKLQDSLMIPILKNELTLNGKWLNGETQTCRCVSTL